MSDRTQPTTRRNDEESVEVLGAPQSVGVIKPEIPNSLKIKTKDPLAFKKAFDKVGKIAVKPFVDNNNSENMGLENYRMVIFPGIHQEEQLAAIERNGVVRFITGLDEFAPEVQNIDDNEQKEAVIYNIRSIVSHLEKMLATNVIKVDDPEFWNKVKLLKPDNKEFWSTVSLRCSNDDLILEPSKDPYDLIKFVAIEAGGFDLVAKSYEDALAKSVAPKWYLDKEVNTVSTKASYKRLRNTAITILDNIANKNPKKLLYITKAIDTNSATYKNGTPTDILYDVLDEYIAGNGVEGNKNRAAEYFMEVSNLDMETLKLRALVKDGSFYRFIVPKPDGMLYHNKTSAMMGRNVSDVVLYLKNPINEQILMTLMKEVEQYWNN